VRINVGGKIFNTKFSNLLNVKDTIFYCLLAKRLDRDGEVPKNFFFDRNYTYFPLILDYLRNKSLSLRAFNKEQKAEIVEELDFYGIDLFQKGKIKEIDIEWDQGLSKSGACTVDINDKRVIKIHSNTCYTHFLTNRTFSQDENFQIEFETTVTQTDSYYYIGIINESYSTSGNCGCCNPSNAYYIKCDGTAHINSASHSVPNFAWQSATCIIGMKVNLSEKKISFYRDGEENECGPYDIGSGNNFRVFAGHCNTGNGTLTITKCLEL